MAHLPCRSLWLEIDLDRLAENFAAFRRMVGPDVKIMPAVKANAYGHGIVHCCLTLEECGADCLGVGNISEAVMLREAGVRIPLLIFASNTIAEAADMYIKYDLIPTVFTAEHARAISAAAKGPKGIFVKIDTGRGRLGVNAEDFPAFFRELSSMPNIRVDGVYSHMCATGWPDAANPSKGGYAEWQEERFDEALKGIGADADGIAFLQMANTPASIARPDMRLTGICPGRGIWGYSPLERREGHPDLAMPMTAMKSRILHINGVIGGKFGENGAAKRLDSPKRIGVMAGGVSDGISPKHKDGYVLVRGKRVPIASDICLEHTILDLSGLPEAQVGDEVVVFGRQGSEEITIKSLTDAWGKTLVEFFTSFTPHIARVYLRGGNAVACTD